jgi:hypothetical protein
VLQVPKDLLEFQVSLVRLDLWDHLVFKVHLEDLQYLVIPDLKDPKELKDVTEDQVQWGPLDLRVFPEQLVLTDVKECWA